MSYLDPHIKEKIVELELDRIDFEGLQNLQKNLTIIRDDHDTSQPELEVALKVLYLIEEQLNWLKVSKWEQQISTV